MRADKPANGHGINGYQANGHAANGHEANGLRARQLPHKEPPLPEPHQESANGCGAGKGKEKSIIGRTPGGRGKYPDTLCVTLVRLSDRCVELYLRWNRRGGFQSFSLTDCSLYRSPNA